MLYAFSSTQRKNLADEIKLHRPDDVKLFISLDRGTQFITFSHMKFDRKKKSEDSCLISSVRNLL
jgi:hypothetical protein